MAQVKEGLTLWALDVDGNRLVTGDRVAVFPARPGTKPEGDGKIVAMYKTHSLPTGQVNEDIDSVLVRVDRGGDAWYYPNECKCIEAEFEREVEMTVLWPLPEEVAMAFRTDDVVRLRFPDDIEEANRVGVICTTRTMVRTYSHGYLDVDRDYYVVWSSGLEFWYPPKDLSMVYPAPSTEAQTVTLGGPHVA
jgi:hypothetical protein